MEDTWQRAPLRQKKALQEVQDGASKLKLKDIFQKIYYYGRNLLLLTVTKVNRGSERSEESEWKFLSTCSCLVLS